MEWYIQLIYFENQAFVMFKVNTNILYYFLKLRHFIIINYFIY